MIFLEKYRARHKSLFLNLFNQGKGLNLFNQGKSQNSFNQENGQKIFWNNPHHRKDDRTLLAVSFHDGISFIHHPGLFLRKAVVWAGVCLAAFVLAVGSAGAQNFSNWSPDQGSGAVRPGVNESQVKQASSVEEIMKMVEPPKSEGAVGHIGGQYTLGPNDVIQVMVMRHPEVSGEYVINQEGKIQYEFVGDIFVSGMSKEEASEVIVQALSEYIVSPEVTVKISQYNSKIVYVVGEVFNPGKIYMRGDTITVREALIQAGLPRLSGITKKSRLITPSDDGRPKRKMINVYALLYEGDLRQNTVMQPGDVLYIPPTFLTRVMRVISPVAAPVGQAAGVRVGTETIGGTRDNY
jgi:polysaccharide export outer membrane protein